MIRKLGMYDISTRRVAVYTDSESISATYDIREDITKMVIGIKCEFWNDTVDLLLHETIELAMMELRLTYVSSPNCAGSSDSYTYIMTHPQFSEVSARAARLITPCLPDLSKVWQKHHKKGKKCR